MAAAGTQAGLTRRLEEFWYGGAVPPLSLRGLEHAFATAVRIRRAAYRRGWLASMSLGVPVVVVGNLSVGGTGKTPLVIWLARALSAKRIRTAIVTRGYGGRREARMVTPDADPGDAGDEAVLLARRSGVPVAAGADRVAAGHLLLEYSPQVLLSDDGLQHYRLFRDVEIAVIDGRRGFGNGRLLPAGPLREPPQRLEAVDAVVLNGPGPSPRADAMRMALQAHVAQSLTREEARALETFRGVRVHALAGIGHPARFFSLLRERGIEVDAHPFPDHARFSAEDLQFDDGAPVLMTEKDAVKCEPFAHERCWYVPIDAHFCEADAARMLKLVTGCVTELA